MASKEVDGRFLLLTCCLGVFFIAAMGGFNNVYEAFRFGLGIPLVMFVLPYSAVSTILGAFKGKSYPLKRKWLIFFSVPLFLLRGPSSGRDIIILLKGKSKRFGLLLYLLKKKLDLTYRSLPHISGVILIKTVRFYIKKRCSR